MIGLPNIQQLIVGLFDEARIHLTGLKQMVELRGGITEDSIRGSSMLAAIITYVLQTCCRNPPTN